MASTIIAVPANTWVQVTTTDKEGSIRHKQGGKVAYVEAAALPVGYDVTTAAMQTTSIAEVFTYYGIAAGDNLYAYALDSDAEIVKAPKGA